MPRSATATKRGQGRSRKSSGNRARKPISRFTVGLAPVVVNQVERYAQTVDASMSKAIAALVRLGLESQEERRRAFFTKLKKNLASDDPNQQERLVDEFRTLILGRE